MTPFEIVSMEPTGTRRTAGFRCPGGFAEWDEPVYPANPWRERLRAARLGPEIPKADREPAGPSGLQLAHQNVLGLREAARIAGLAASQLSALEFGRAALRSDAEWQRLVDVIDAARLAQVRP